MSDTKWRRLIEAVATANPSIRLMTVKFIDSEQPKRMRFPPSLQLSHPYIDTIEYGPIELRSIEWMELPADIKQLLSLIGRFPIEMVEAGTRVVGYKT